jgi:AcrR family transcriptional regulator
MMVVSNIKEKKLRRIERRAAIIRGAGEAFVKNGYEATSLDDVAKSAGVSRALLYRHFDTKQAIYSAVLDNFIDNLHGNVVKPLENKWSDATLGGLVSVAQIDPNGFRLFFRHAVREPDFRKYHDDLTAKRLNFIENNLKNDIIDAQQRRFIAALVQEIVIGTILIWVDNGMPEPEKIPKLISGILKTVTESEA